MKFKILFISLALLFVSNIAFSEKSILYITDNTHTSKIFNTKYIDMLKSLADDNLGKNKVNISDLSRFDLNTTQCLEIFDMLHNKEHQDAIVLTIGDSNYHNLYGFSKYMKNSNIDKAITIKSPKNVYEINSEMLKLYAVSKQSTLTKIVDNVYNSLMGSDAGTVFIPKVIPNFYILKNTFVKDDNFMATMNTYSYALDLIRREKYDEAQTFLNNIIEKKPSQSMLYYALGVAYLSENGDGCEFKALQCFEDGILVDPLNRENICYKGLAFLYMAYKGDITAEVLYFARGLNKYITFPSEEFEAIMAINTTNYDEKIEVINNWILSDMDKLKNKAVMSDTKLIFASYPEDIPINSLISEYVKNSSRVLYIDNKIDDKEISDFVVYRFAKKMYDFLRENKIIN